MLNREFITKVSNLCLAGHRFNFDVLFDNHKLYTGESEEAAVKVLQRYIHDTTADNFLSMPPTELATIFDKLPPQVQVCMQD